MSLLVYDGDFFRMKNPPPAFSRLDGLFRNIKEVSSGKNLSVFARKEIGFRLREKVVIILAQQLITRIPKQVFTCAIKSGKPQVFGILDENHVRNVLKDGLHETLGL